MNGVIKANTFENELRNKLIKLALLQQHKLYVHGSHGPDTFDCAGFVWYVYNDVCQINIYNNGIRNQILFREGELESGDMVMIAKNNYYWTKPSNSGDKEEQMANQPEFVANGDIAQVQRVRNVRELFGFHFADCTLSFPDYETPIPENS